MEYNKEHKVPVIDLGVQPVDIKAINILPSTKKDAVEVPVSTPSGRWREAVFSFGCVGYEARVLIRSAKGGQGDGGGKACRGEAYGEEACGGEAYVLVRNEALGDKPTFSFGVKPEEKKEEKKEEKPMVLLRGFQARGEEGRGEEASLLVRRQVGRDGGDQALFLVRTSTEDKKPSFSFGAKPAEKPEEKKEETKLHSRSAL